MDSYTHIAMCRVSAYICVYVVPVKCEKCSLKGTIWAKTRNLPIYCHITFFSAGFVTIPMDRYAHIVMCRLSAYICAHVVPVKCENVVQKVKFGAKTRYLLIYYHITFLRGIFVAIPMDTYTCCNV